MEFEAVFSFKVTIDNSVKRRTTVMTGPEYTTLRQSVKMSQMYGITGKTKHVMLDISFTFVVGLT